MTKMQNPFNTSNETFSLPREGAYFPPSVLRGRVRVGVVSGELMVQTPSPTLPRNTEGGRRDRVTPLIACVFLILLMLALPSLAEDAIIRIDAAHPSHPISRYLTGACIEDVNHEVYGGIYSQLLFGESFQEPPPKQADMPISGMWSAVKDGSAILRAEIETDRPFVGNRSQRITFVSGEGRAGIENRGLNRQGISFVNGKEYEGYLWARAREPIELTVSLEGADGSRRLAQTKIKISGADEWHRADFSLTANASDPAGRFVIALTSPGSVVLGHAFLQPGAWGRFKNLPLRRDVVEGLIDQGITVLRYGGSMVNEPQYRWKKMIGPRDRRPPYHGTWYPYSSNGWGIIDFLDLCESSGFLAIPAFNMGENPQDMADFIEYVNGAADSQWGQRRVEGGHPNPYKLRYIELGNEERIDDNYFAKFQPIAEAIWAKDATVTLVVGDFLYSRRIEDPYHFTGAASKITTLAGHKRILDLAKSHNGEVDFDLHVGTEGPRPDSTLDGAFSFIDALTKIADGARFKVLIFEFNANNHAQKRALANAIAINRIERDGRIPIATSANCLQVDKQNNNGWNQGLLFLNPTSIWLQPPGYVTRMYSRRYQPQSLPVESQGDGKSVDVSASRSEDGKTLVVRAVNATDAAVSCELRIAGFSPTDPQAQVELLAADLNARNTAEQPQMVSTKQSQWAHQMRDGVAKYEFPAHSVVVMRFE
jgi:hypothetical protein